MLKIMTFAEYPILYRISSAKKGFLDPQPMIRLFLFPGFMKEEKAEEGEVTPEANVCAKKCKMTL